jgi:hypothetical protein
MRAAVSVETIRRRIADGTLAAVRLGPTDRHPLRVREDDLLRFISSPSDVSDDGSPAGGSFAGMNPAARRGTSNVGEAVEPAGERGDEQ